ILLDHVDRHSIAIKQSRSGDYELKLEVRALFDRSQRGFDPTVARARSYKNTDFTTHQFSPSTSTSVINSSAFLSRTRRRPIRSGNLEAGIPAPAFFTAKCSAARAVPAARLAPATTLFMNMPRSGAASFTRTSLSTGLACITSMKRTPSTSCFSSEVVTEADT